jgi:hypothetical protein
LFGAGASQEVTMKQAEFSNWTANKLNQDKNQPSAAEIEL